MSLNHSWPAPAKINRFLHIIGRRADGYHLLQTIFQFLDRCDFLTFTARHDSLIECAYDPSIPDLDHDLNNDLTVKAARLLQNHTGHKQGVSVAIEKNIPIGGGLGGGSSDAATTLVALNHYWQTGLSDRELAQLGLQLGADVPVFIHGQAAWAEGIGEKLTPVMIDQPWLLVLVPDCHVSTAAIFSHPQLTRDAETSKMRAFIADSDRNDCEALVFRLYPQIAKTAKWLSQYSQARLTGTGACVFATFAEREQAEQVLAQKPASLPATGFISRACNHSHLREKRQREKIA